MLEHVVVRKLKRKSPGALGAAAGSEQPLDGNELQVGSSPQIVLCTACRVQRAGTWEGKASGKIKPQLFQWSTEGKHPLGSSRLAVARVFWGAAVPKVCAEVETWVSTVLHPHSRF